MKFRPLYDRLVIDYTETENKYGKLVLPQDVSIQPTVAKVLRCGPGGYQNGRRVDMDVKEGDLVIFDKQSIELLEYNGEKIYTIRLAHVLGCMDP